MFDCFDILQYIVNENFETYIFEHPATERSQDEGILVEFSKCGDARFKVGL